MASRSSAEPPCRSRTRNPTRARWSRTTSRSMSASFLALISSPEARTRSRSAAVEVRTSTPTSAAQWLTLAFGWLSRTTGRILTVNERAYHAIENTSESQQNLRVFGEMVEDNMRHAGMMVQRDGAVCGVDNTNGPDVLYVPNRCILCTRCVRFMESVAEAPVLNVSERGDRAYIGIAEEQLLDHPWAGNVVDLCPVGSLLSKDFLHKARAA